MHVFNLQHLLMLFLATSGTKSANILAIIPYPSISHSIPFVPLFQTLATQHNVTVITSNPNSIHPNSNVKVIDVSEVYHHDLPTELIETITGYNIGKHHEVFRVVVQNPDVRALLLDEDNGFDLVLTDITSPIWNVIGRRFSCPLIGLLPYDVYLVHVKLGTPTNPAVHSDSTIGLSYDMNTLEKIYNILMGLLLLSNDFFYTQQKIDYYLEEYFPKTSSLNGSAKNEKNIDINMLFVNLIPGFHKLRAIHDNTKYIGSGQKYLVNYNKTNDYGSLQNIIIVYVEFNDNESHIKLCTELQKLEETILWVKHPKYESCESQKIKTIQPYEFQDILSLENKPSITLLITNGDTHHIEVSLQYTIPLLVILPEVTTGNEMQNAQKLKQENIAKVLHIGYIEQLGDYVTDITLRNNEYRKSIEKYSINTRTPLSGLGYATIWIEWLIEHRNTLEGIKSSTSKINYVESWYIDIAGALLVSIFIGLTVLLFLGSKSIEFITRAAAKKELVY